MKYFFLSLVIAASFVSCSKSYDRSRDCNNKECSCGTNCFCSSKCPCNQNNSSECPCNQD